MGDVRRSPWPLVGMVLGFAWPGLYARPGYCLLCAVTAFIVSLCALRGSAPGEPRRWMAVAGLVGALLGFLYLGGLAYLIYSVVTRD